MPRQVAASVTIDLDDLITSVAHECLHDRSCRLKRIGPRVGRPGLRDVEICEQYREPSLPAGHQTELMIRWTAESAAAARRGCPGIIEPRPRGRSSFQGSIRGV